MMQNSSFVYHPESLIEMQVICLVILYYYSNREHIDEIDGIHSKELVKDNQSPNFIMAALMIEHIFSYFCAFFRAYDIKKNG